MSSVPDRGKFFKNPEKTKPSQPDVFGDCVIDAVAYEIRGFKRGEELALHIALPRGDKNTYPPDAFRGSLDPVARPVAPKGKKGAPPPDLGPIVAWQGVIVGEDHAYQLTATEKQGKSDVYWVLTFEKTEKPSGETEWVDADQPES
ncbi:MAG TPA: hypothetical protein VGM90_13940 [Kofleriaceae bacterium]|jgi:hypothetical protein